jgi:Ca2+:H+ antiporter
VATVIVAIVGNAAEHGGAIVLARRGGNLEIANEIALSSSAQVALLVTPAVALLSWVVKPALPLSFRPVELAALGAAVLFVGGALRDGNARRREGLVLVCLYALVALGFYLAGDR